MKIGIVGTGRMGANMARRLKQRGHELVALYDLDAVAAAALGRELGAPVAPTLAEVSAAAEVVITVVSDDDAMQEIYGLDGDSLLAHAEGRVFLNCATVSPETHVMLAEEVEAAGGRVLEACMASSITQAREGSLYLMVGGRREDFEELKPLLLDLSTAPRYVGAAGRAAEVKALVNMVMNINTAALAEGLALGAALNHDLDMLREVFSQTGAASRVLETDALDMITREHECFFSAEHAAKDSAIANDLAESAGVDVPLSWAAQAQYERLIEMGLGHLDKSAVAELTFLNRQGEGL
jgi:3-hydroxyisobutyrate dehydrogenase